MRGSPWRAERQCRRCAICASPARGACIAGAAHPAGAALARAASQHCLHGARALCAPRPIAFMLAPRRRGRFGDALAHRV
ncbi:hypothetical protein [Lysobacter sp. yr284]|uniref:hypothetical protein n=1 Tax=Lysobacter sp. yr284 TaxID=1761791 RepID=UPI00111342A4|nr:hypothetical protein [Lysobacter sp. yr284]